MKTISLMLLITLTGIPGVSAQTQETEQLLLNVEKLSQFKRLLQDMKNGYQALRLGYTTISDLSEGNFNVHQVFLDGLMQVSPAVSRYHRVADIVRCQLTLVTEYKKAFTRFKQEAHFSTAELAYMGQVYTHLFQESLKNLDALALVITAGQLRMSDDERLQAIDRIYADIQDQLGFLRRFNGSTALLALQRTREQNNIGMMQALYGASP